MNQLKSLLTVQGTVVSGKKLGRSLGFPTANLDCRPSQLKNIKPGVYLAKCQVAKEKLTGLVYYGPRHMLNQTHNNFEVYLFNYHQDIYDQEITVTLTHFLRPPIKFKSVKAMKQQINQDKAMAETLTNK